MRFILLLGAVFVAWAVHAAEPPLPAWYTEANATFLRQVAHSPDSALVTAEEVLRKAKALGDVRLELRAHAMLGQAWNMKGHAAKALPHFLQGLHRAEAVGDVYRIAMLNANVAEVLLGQRQWAASARHGQRAVSGFEACGQTIWAGAAMQDLALALVAQGKDDSARILLERAVPLLEVMQMEEHLAELRSIQQGLAPPPDEADSTAAPGLLRLRHRMQFARTLRHLGLLERADTLLQAVIQDAGLSGFDQERMEALDERSGVLAELGRAGEAHVLLREHLALRDTLTSLTTARAVAEVQTAFDVARKDAALQAQQLLISRQRAWLAAGSLLVVLGGLFVVHLWYTRRHKAALAAQLVERNTALDAALADKELLLQELQHRVKNNLQLVGGLLRMQDRTITDPAAQQAMRESQDLVRSLTLIHQDLTGHGSVRGIAMQGYVERLVGGLLRSHGNGTERIAVSLEVEPVQLDVDSAIPIGLVLHELIVNALKHAFPNGRKGTLRVVLRLRDKGLELVVQDDGVGLPNAADNADPTGQGLGLLRTFAEKLQAEHQVDVQKGTTVRLLIHQFTLAT